jgi:Ca-activated chloride channel family protein
MEKERMIASLRPAVTGLAFLAAVATLGGQPRFRNGVEIVNVTATVSDASGRFVSGLQERDFAVYDNGERQPIAQFSTERLPVSLGIALDTSGSMAGSKIDQARAALNRFLEELLDPGDEIFLYRFSDHPVLLEGWTGNRAALARALDGIKPDGGTALYDTVADAVPLAGQGRNRKKALVLISDGNDTSSNTPLVGLRRLIRDSEVLVYAVGIDSDAPAEPGQPPSSGRPGPPAPPRGGSRPPVGPFPGRIGRPPGFSLQAALTPRRAPAGNDRVNAAALRELTDESGGRTEIVRDARDLEPATASIADELSKQYDVSYLSSAKKDGLWHDIRVEVTNPAFRVRARRGYFAN